jgi:hypothetical protein
MATTPCPVQGLVCPTTGQTSVVTRALIVYRKSQPTPKPFPATCLRGPLSQVHLVHLSSSMHVRAAAFVCENTKAALFFRSPGKRKSCPHSFTEGGGMG